MKNDHVVIQEVMTQKICGHEYHLILFGTIGLWYIKAHIYEEWKLKKDFFIFTTLNAQSGHEIFVMNTKYVFTSIIWMDLALSACDISKYTFIRPGSSKNTLLFNFDHFKYSTWSSNSGYEHKICCHKYPLVFWLYGLVIYQNTFIRSGSSTKEVLFYFDYLKHSMW